MVTNLATIVGTESGTYISEYIYIPYITRSNRINLHISITIEYTIHMNINAHIEI